MAKSASDKPAGNIALWSSVEETNPQYTRAFERPGGFSGTTVNATYLVRRATEVFGPCGIGWGYEILDEDFLYGPVLTDKNGSPFHGEPMEKIHRIRLRVWYVLNGEVGVVTHMGQTTFVGKNRYGAFADEEAPKKSLTDALVKCLSMLGFAGDVHLGKYDDNKYVEEVRNKYTTANAPTITEEQVQMLRDEIARLSIDEVKFLEAIPAKSLDAILESQLPRAWKGIRKKRELLGLDRNTGEKLPDNTTESTPPAHAEED